MVISSFAYQHEVRRYNNVQVERTGIELTIGRFFQQMHVIGKDDFKETIRNWTFKLLETRPGLELINRITKFNKPFYVVKSDQSHCHYGEQCLIEIETHERDYIGLKGETFKMPCEIIFAHELKHLLNYYENPKNTLNNIEITTDLIDPDFHNIEEQFVTTGLVKFKRPSGMPIGNYYYIDGCNDNAFLAAFNKPFRINHL